MYKCEMGETTLGLTNRDRKSCNPIVVISIPSILIEPFEGSVYRHLSILIKEKRTGTSLTKRRMLIANVDLPLPMKKN